MVAMEEVLKAFLEDYSSITAAKLTDVKGKRDAYNPVLFIFIGDGVKKAVLEIEKIIRERWSNSAGVGYFYLSNKEKIANDWLKQVNYNFDDKDIKEFRSNLYNYFLTCEEKLMEIGNNISKIKEHIMESGSIFTIFQKLSINIVTSAQDPMNALTIPITILLEEKLKNDFGEITIDLFEILEERDVSEQDDLKRAVAISFFKEIEISQGKDFVFRETVDVLKSGTRLEVLSDGRKVFDTIYLLSDRNRKGYLLKDAMIKNSQAVAYLCILKNGNPTQDINPYDDSIFKGSAGYGNERQVYASIGFSRVKRPNDSIAATIIYAYYYQMLKNIKERSQNLRTGLLSFFKLDDETLSSRVDKFISPAKSIEMMTGIMPINSTRSVRYFKNMNLKGFERELYADFSIKFFKRNYEENALKLLDVADIKRNYKTEVYKGMVESSKHGIFSVFEWTKDENLLAQIGNLKKDIQNKINNKDNEINASYNKRVRLSILYFLPWFKDKILYKVKENLFGEIYSLKLERLKLQLKNELICKFEECIKEIHKELEDGIGLSEELLNTLKEYSDLQIDINDEFVGGNIKGYYTAEVSKDVEKMDEEQKESFINLFKNTKFGKEALYKELILNCKSNLLKEDKYFKPFEQEVHDRANAATNNEIGSVIGWEELYKRIYTTLENNAEVHMHFKEFTLKNVYEEEYFFGNYDSQFVKYAFRCGSSLTNRKQGCANEKDSKGIEKLKLIGGFYIDNLTFYNEWSANYEYFTKQGYKFHGIDIDAYKAGK